MGRWLTPFVGFAILGLVVALVARNFHAPKAIGRDPSRAGRDGGVDDGGGTALGVGDGGAVADDGASPNLESDLATAARARRDGGVGAFVLDSTGVPPLPFATPRQVRFGVILVAYAGAQPSVGGGRPSGRSRADAKTLADRLVATAAQDFHAAVQQGDTGSADDIGRVRLGVLEPALEYVLFTLPVAGVGGPVDSPRGYWIVKRLE